MKWIGTILQTLKGVLLQLFKVDGFGGGDLQVNKFEPGPQWSHGDPIENRQTDRHTHTHTHTTENIMFPQLRGKNINLVLKVRTNVDS